ncbi:hypothetical protein [Nostoc sp. 'Peltigera membranacea cyanobiont' 210A]|nr:hypothetical protein [Nostoc sp. 'Peltigera membranacea cyanobiont' 210A]
MMSLVTFLTNIDGCNIYRPFLGCICDVYDGLRLRSIEILQR